ncbi:uncharacterized protein LOC123532803 [Mercenaria mercenaria]|uniref:uncharacterized protein LOC123532803 n=1 Tax=Mercenaria mercenaria TaxID=6596 RepID=UPI00234ED48D|nr:uncharacterized protein LOC123532803 [Mercenaria mercenaria]
MDAGRHLACRHAADRDKHENMNEKEDTDPLGIASLLFGCEANTPTETTPIIIPSGQVDRSQSVYSETLSSRYGTSLNAEIKHDLERISRQIVDTGDRILKDTRCCIADLRHDVEQRFRSLEFGVGRLKSTETDEDEGYNTIELLTDRTRLEEIQNACKQKEKDVMSYLETGAVGGTVCTGYEVNDSAPEWKIDDESWEACIKNKDRKEAQRLIFERILLTQEMLHNASIEFGRNSETLKAICDEIRLYIKAQSKEIANVYAAYKTIHNTRTEESAIVFAAITATKIQTVNAFDYNVEQICIDEVNNSQENKDIQQRENSNSVPEEKINKAVRRMKRHSQGLMKRHSNITRISVSWIKSTRYGLADAAMTNEVCISLYVPKKGLIPIDEEPFPKILNGFSVDVREGICVPFLGSHDVHDTVKMGCAISGQSFAGQSNIGTLGGFIEIENEIYCLTCAHVFAQNPNLKNLQRNGIWAAKFPVDDNSVNYVYQPTPPSEPFGTLVRAVFIEGGDGTTGVDAAVIHVRKRFPNSGIFPDAANDREAGFDQENPMTFHSGKISQSPKRMVLVVKHGSASGITKGSFRLRGSTIRTNTAQNWGFMLFNQYEIESVGDTMFAKPGDSGAMVFAIEGNELLGIGMVEAGMGNICLVTPIYDVFSALNIPRPFKMKQFMQGNTNTDIPVSCDKTSATENRITQSERTNDLKERLDYMDQALSQEFARQANEMKEELHLKVDQQLLDLKTEINEKIESDRTKLQTNIDRSMTRLEEKMNDMQNKNRDHMLQMKESMEEMLGKFLSQIKQNK